MCYRMFLSFFLLLHSRWLLSTLVLFSLWSFRSLVSPHSSLHPPDSGLWQEFSVLMLNIYVEDVVPDHDINFCFSIFCIFVFFFRSLTYLYYSIIVAHYATYLTIWYIYSLITDLFLAYPIRLPRSSCSSAQLPEFQRRMTSSTWLVCESQAKCASLSRWDWNTLTPRL